MQANCFIFPAPRQFKFSSTIKKILLVPKQKNLKYSFYHSELLDLPEDPINDFQIFLNTQVNKSMSKSNAQTKQTEKSQTLINNSNSERSNQIKTSKSNKTAIKHLLKNESSIVTQQSLPKVSEKQYVPCFFMPGTVKNKIIVFFHANGQDISSSQEFIRTISNQLNITILAMEYQGYSIYQGSTNPTSIIEDAKIVMDFLIEQGVQQKDIILLGRSIGGGMAFSVGALYKVGCIVLLSPFLSLKKIAQDLYGSCSSALLKQTFDNEHNAKSIQSPILLIHGLKDQLVPYQHSLAILGECKAFCRLHLIQNMTHSKFSFRKDFTIPLKCFLKDVDIVT